MKKHIGILIMMVALTIGGFSQDFMPSIGLEVAIPTGDFGDAYTLGYGLSAAAELPLGDNLGVTLTAGYLLLSPDSEIKDFIKSSSMIPIQAGLKYYFSEQQSGIYAHVQVGVHSFSLTTEDFDFGGITVKGETTSESNLSFAPGAGFMINEKLDLALRYNIITAGSDEGAESSSYLGFRVAYGF